MVTQRNDPDDRHTGLQFFYELQLIPPRDAYILLEQHGYRGQESARRSLTLLAYRHVRRLKRIYLEGTPREDLPPKSNFLLLGPTGCGKTHLIELMFRHILDLPTVVIDMSGFSETGYIGEDTKTLLTRLILAADGNPMIASAGVVCLDEFDKLATSQNTGRFDGQGTTKDVTGFGVQRELLRMMEPGMVEVPLDMNNSIYSSKQPLFTGDITFIATGAFSGLKLTAASGGGEYAGGHLGFRADTELPDEMIAVELEHEEVNDIENFQRYGFLPELMGRFNRVVPMAPLDRETLMQILRDNVIGPYVAEFAEEQLELEIPDAVLQHVVERAMERQTGARGLNAVLTHHLETVAFERFCGRPGRVRLELRGSEVHTSYEG